MQLSLFYITLKKKSESTTETSELLLVISRVQPKKTKLNRTLARILKQDPVSNVFKSDEVGYKYSHPRGMFKKYFVSSSCWLCRRHSCAQTLSCMFALHCVD